MARLRAKEGKRNDCPFCGNKTKGLLIYQYIWHTLFGGWRGDQELEIKGCKISKCKPSKVGQLVSCKLGRRDEACVLGQLQNTMFWFTLRAKESGRAQPRTDRAQHRHARGQETKPTPRNKCNLLTLLATEL